MTPDQALRLATDVLLHLADDPAELGAFLQASGLRPEDLRQIAQEPGLAAALLDHLVQSDELILACARALNIPPRDIMAARTALAGPGSYGWSVD